MKILILGAGGIGGYFGGRLADAGADVTFIVRPRRAAQIAEQGLVVRSAFGDIQQAVKAVQPGMIDGAYDFVLLSCKAYDLDDAIATIAPGMGPQTAVLPLLNGLAHLDRLDEAFGAERVLGGVAKIGATLASNGEVKHLNKVHEIIFGERSGQRTQRCQALEAVLKTAKFDSRLSDSIVQDMWEKLVMLGTLAAMTCLMRAPVGHIVATEEGEALMLKAMDESVAIASAAGHAPRPASLTEIRNMLTARGSMFGASMWRDIEQNGRIEGDHIVGDLVNRARAAGIPAPLLSIAYTHLQAYEIRRAQEQQQKKAA
jgi:2-dehydropantoate 2-reductase